MRARARTEVLLVKAYLGQQAEWADAFADFDVEVRGWDAPGAPEEADYALVWEPEPGALARLPNLKAVFSLGAGLDHLVGEDLVPPGVPVIRMVDAALTAGMTEYVLYHVLRFHRFMPQYEAQQRDIAWRELPQIPARERRVGLLGLGVMGRAAAEALVSLGFDVAGWSRAEKRIDGVASYHGERQLGRFLARTDILVCLLPLTPQTENILGAGNLARLPEGAFVINAGRGGHCDEAALLAALDSGHIRGAALDVFAHEPLAKASPLWRHDAVHITPHIAAKTLPATAAQHVIDNITRLRAGRAPTHVADFSRGY